MSGRPPASESHWRRAVRGLKSAHQHFAPSNSHVGEGADMTIDAPQPSTGRKGLAAARAGGHPKTHAH